MFQDYGLAGQLMNKFHHAYILISADKLHRYVGYTSDLQARLAKHNSGEVSHTAKHGPWEIGTAMAFTSKDKALRFEKYLKPGSGREFSRRHF